MKKNLTKENLEIKCSECGKVTKHYLASNGEYRCLVCGTVNKVITPTEIVFETDEEFDKELNPDLEVEETNVEEAINNAPVSADLTETPVETI